MTSPKEKAIELVHKFKCYTGRYYNSKANLVTSKQCALIAVDEIKEAITWITDEMYWQEVKQEILNL